MYLFTMKGLFEEIPVIDFSAYNLTVDKDGVSNDDENLRNLARDVISAFTTVGFVYFTNHGIQETEVVTARHTVDEFFQLPEETKSQYRYKKAELQHGWVGVEQERLEKDKPADMKECYNVTPQCADSWPEAEVPQFRKSVMTFYQRCDDLARRIVEVITMGLGIKEKDFFTRHFNSGKCPNRTTLRFLHYPPIKQDLKPGQSRLGEHTDYGCITLLFQDDVGGLEIKRTDGRWIPAHPIPGTVLVNIADVMQRWTADKLVSTPHRVYSKLDGNGCSRERRSMAYFVHPDEDTLITCVDGSNKYQPITDVDYLTRRCQNTYL